MGQGLIYRWGSLRCVGSSKRPRQGKGVLHAAERQQNAACRSRDTHLVPTVLLRLPPRAVKPGFGRTREPKPSYRRVCSTLPPQRCRLWGKKKLGKKWVYLNRSLEVTAGKNSAPVNHNQTTIPVCSTSLLPMGTQLRGSKLMNLLQQPGHADPVGRHQHCQGCKSGEQGEAASAVTHLSRRSPDQTRHPPARPCSNGGQSGTSQTGPHGL